MILLHLEIILPLLAATTAATTTAQNGSIANPAPAAVKACEYLKWLYPDSTIFPGDSLYQNETQKSWSAAAWLQPACVFTPTNAVEASWAIRTFKRYGTLFAMRGGGHMPIADAANIDSSGVLLSSSKLTRIALSSDNSHVSVQPGNRWGDVYEYLEPFGLSVVGGRIGSVGVPGLLLGGGVSFFGEEYGFASSTGNVRAFECVLADGQIVEATVTNNHSDLFWALQGGGNSFCFATRFELRTLIAPEVYVGLKMYGPGVSDQWLSSIYNWAHYGSQDHKSAQIPIMFYGAGLPGPLYNAFNFYNGNNSAPKALENFTEPVLNPVSSTFAYRSMHNYSLESEATQGERVGLRQRFYLQSFRADLDAMRAVHDIYLSTAEKYHLANMTNLLSVFTFNTITKGFVEASNRAHGGNPQGLDVEEAPYIWLEENLSYADVADEPLVDRFVAEVNALISAELEHRGVISKHLYINEANKGQPVFEGYPKENLKRLKQIRAKYDPEMVFTKLVPGGFKVEHA